jgi:hypothetical protein
MRGRGEVRSVTYHSKDDEDIVGTKCLADEGSCVKSEKANAGRNAEEDQVDNDRNSTTSIGIVRIYLNVGRRKQRCLRRPSRHCLKRAL